MGTLYLRLGDRAAATDAFGSAITVAPTLADDPALLTGEAADLRAGALALAYAAWRPDGWDFALLAGDAAEATRRADVLTGAPHDRALQVIAAWNGDADARAQIATAAKASPFDPLPVGWSARLARRAGDEFAAERYRA